MQIQSDKIIFFTKNEQKKYMIDTSYKHIFLKKKNNIQKLGHL